MPQLSEHRKSQLEMHRSVAGMYRRRAAYPFAEDFQEERNEALLALAPTGAEGRVLDLGCGTGLMLDRLAVRFARVVGVDLSGEMLAGYDRARPRAAGTGVVSLARTDITALPFAAGTVDVVLCRSVLHHMDDEVAVLREIRRVLRPSGRLVVGEPANDNPLFRAARWFVRRRPSFGRIHTIDRAYTRRQLRGMFAAAGFVVHREVRFGFVAYTFCDNPELVPVLKWLPAGLARGTGRALRAVDRALGRLPLVRSLSWYTLLDVRPRASS